MKRAMIAAVSLMVLVVLTVSFNNVVQADDDVVIEGFAFIDANLNGFHEVSEIQGVSGVKVQIYSQGVYSFTWTEGINGYYRFEGLSNQLYGIEIFKPEGYAYTSPSSGPVDLRYVSYARKDFGLWDMSNGWSTLTPTPTVTWTSTVTSTFPASSETETSTATVTGTPTGIPTIIDTPITKVPTSTPTSTPTATVVHERFLPLIAKGN